MIKDSLLWQVCNAVILQVSLAQAQYIQDAGTDGDCRRFYCIRLFPRPLEYNWKDA